MHMIIIVLNVYHMYMFNITEHYIYLQCARTSINYVLW